MTTTLKQLAEGALTVERAERLRRDHREEEQYLEKYGPGLERAVRELVGTELTLRGPSVMLDEIRQVVWKHTETGGFTIAMTEPESDVVFSVSPDYPNPESGGLYVSVKKACGHWRSTMAKDLADVGRVLEETCNCRDEDVTQRITPLPAVLGGSLDDNAAVIAHNLRVLCLLVENVGEGLPLAGRGF